MTTDHYDVAIATPGKMFHAEYVKSLVATIAELERQGITYTFLNRYSSFVPTARELTAIDASQHDYSHSKIANGRFTCGKIFWIDSDIEWKPTDFLELYRSELPIVSGLYALDHEGLVAVSLLELDGSLRRARFYDLMLEDEILSVGGVGFGFLCVDAGLWESIPRPWFKIQETLYQGTVVNVGEDYSWCMKARAAGHKIYVNQRVRVLHHKEAVYAI